jgi:HK97 family phage major capsid protein
MSDFLTKQIEARQRAWNEAKALLDAAAAENRDLTAEERQTYDRINADLDSRAQLLKDVQAAEAREAEIVRSMEGREAAVRPAAAAVAQRDDVDVMRSLLRGEIRAAEFERRSVLKTSSNAPVPTTFADQVFDQARLVGPMLDAAVVSVLNTASGENYVIPTLSTFSTAGLEGEAASIDASDPAFGKVTLGSFKYAFITQVSAEMAADSNVDILGFVAQQAGNAVGYAVNSVLTTGTGTVQPTGIVTAAGSGITGGTSVSGAFTADNLIDLVYSTDGAARRLPGYGLMANGTSIGAMRKLKTSGGDYVFVPTLQPGTPDTILGYPLIENPHMASTGSATKSVIAGHFPSYMTRTVGGIQVARSDDYAFQNDLVTLRFIIRVDGNLLQSSHVKYFIGNTA